MNAISGDDFYLQISNNPSFINYDSVATNGCIFTNVCAARYISTQSTFTAKSLITKSYADSTYLKFPIAAGMPIFTTVNGEHIRVINGSLYNDHFYISQSTADCGMGLGSHSVLITGQNSGYYICEFRASQSTSVVSYIDGSGNYTKSSSLKYKENVINLNDDNVDYFDIFKKIQINNYEYKSNHHKDNGIIIEEIAQIATEYENNNQNKEAEILNNNEEIVTALDELLLAKFPEPSTYETTLVL